MSHGRRPLAESVAPGMHLAWCATFSLKRLRVLSYRRGSICSESIFLVSTQNVGGGRPIGVNGASFPKNLHTKSFWNEVLGPQLTLRPPTDTLRQGYTLEACRSSTEPFSLPFSGEDNHDNFTHGRNANGMVPWCVAACVLASAGGAYNR